MFQGVGLVGTPGHRTARRAQCSEPLVAKRHALAEPGSAIPSYQTWRQFLKTLRSLSFSPIGWGE